MLIYGITKILWGILDRLLSVGIAYSLALANAAMPTVLTILAIFFILGSFGVKFSTGGVGKVVVTGLVSTVGFIIQQIVRGIGWMLQRILQSVPRVYRGTSRNLAGYVNNQFLVVVISFIITLLYVIFI